MFVQNFAVLCCELFLLIISSSKSQRNYTNDEDEDHNLTVRYEIYADSTTIYSDEIKPLRYDLYERFTDDTQYNEMEYEISTISTNIDREDVDSILHKLRRRSAHNQENDYKILKHSHNNSTNVNHKENSTSQKVYENLLKINDSMSNKVFENFTKNSYESNIVPYETCHNITCIQFCCPFGNIIRWNDTKCIPKERKYVFPNVYEYTNDSTHNKSGRVNEFFQLTVYNKCLESQCYVVPIGHQYDYKIFANGSLFIPYYETLFKSTSYCLGVILKRGRRFEAIFISEQYAELKRNALKHTPEYSWITHVLNIYSSLHLVCILFLVSVFLVYSILPELRNEHGFMLRNYCACLSIVIVIDIVRVLHLKEELSYIRPVCITIEDSLRYKETADNQKKKVGVLCYFCVRMSVCTCYYLCHRCGLCFRLYTNNFETRIQKGILLIWKHLHCIITGSKLSVLLVAFAYPSVRQGTLNAAKKIQTSV
ncbi:uncharacterized protein LOC114943520 [Nylanderia fulva]|uniref:uncharacterized protein LOC114943520 n=1 Tax=Nylanderia fulva TaxID=613905 RepID=UPI0010FB8F03|nr:uncharacterized protein LOC114943520 [Nylanderia fulva]